MERSLVHARVLLPPSFSEPIASAVNILLVGAQPARLAALEEILAPLQQRFVHAHTDEQARSALARQPFAVVLIDGTSEGWPGLEGADPPVPILSLGKGSEENLPAKVGVYLELFRKTEQVKALETSLQASALLASSLDYETTLQNLAKLMVPALADWCALDMVVPGEGTQRLAVQHLDPAKIAFVQELERRYPADPNAPTGMYNVLRTGKTEWVADIPDALIEAGAKDAEHLRLIRHLGLKSYIAVPIAARGRVLGVLSLVMAESGRRYTESDVKRAEDLAARATLFVENARLYQESVATQKRLESLTVDLMASEEKFRSLAEAIPQQVWTATPEGGLDFINGRVRAYFDRPAAELLGHGWARGVHAEDAPACIERWVHCLQTGEPYEVEFRLLNGRDGAYRWHLAQALPVKNAAGHIQKWFGSNTDIHDRKQTEQERERLINALERSNAELDQFAYVASHDLKAPLRGIANLSQWVEDDLSDRMTAESREHMTLLRGRVHRLEALIDGILGFSRAGRTPQKAGEISVSHLLKDVVELLAPPSGILVTWPQAMPTLHTEKVPLQQVLMNLLANAIKHGGTAPAEIRVEAQEEAAFWRFSVQDRGPGIAPDYHEKIWGIFQTLQPRDKVEGTGIGLAVVRKIVHGKGGRAWVESQEGRGATFFFTWPK